MCMEVNDRCPSLPSLYPAPLRMWGAEASCVHHKPSLSVASAQSKLTLEVFVQGPCLTWLGPLLRRKALWLTSLPLTPLAGAELQRVAAQVYSGTARFGSSSTFGSNKSLRGCLCQRELGLSEDPAGLCRSLRWSWARILLAGATWQQGGREQASCLPHEGPLQSSR